MSRQGVLGGSPTQQRIRALPLLRPMGAVISGALLAAAFPPVDLGVLAWGALVPFLWSVRGASPHAAFRLGLLAGGVWFGSLLSWLTLFGIPAWTIVTAITALYIGVFGWFVAWLEERRAGLWPLIVPVAWVAVEFIRSTGPLGFPWGHLGLTQYRFPALIQIASLGGVHLVSLVLVVANVTLLHLVTRRVSPVVLIAGVVVVTATIGFGPWRLARPLDAGAQDVASGVGSLRVAALQPNVSTLQKGHPDTWQSQIDAMRALTEAAAAAGARLIVFPESAIPVDLLGTGGKATEIAGWAPNRVVVASSLETGGGALRNTAVPLSSGRVLGTYAKRRLVPFGEAGITPGDRSGVVTTPAGALGLAICYESAFPELSRRMAQAGARLLVILTNDGWFGTSAGTAQHAAHATLRAVETGRPVARAANTGISLIIDPYGRTLARLPAGARGIITGNVPAPVATPFLRGGWLLAPLMVAATLLSAAAVSVRQIRVWPADPAFRRLAATLIIPGAVVALLPLADSAVPGAIRWTQPVLLLGAAWLTAGGLQGLAWRLSRAPFSALLGLVVVAGLGAALAAAYAAYGIPLVLGPPAGGWVREGMPLLLAALAWETWLRGAVLSAGLAWKGVATALLISSAPGLVLFWNAPAEVLLWSFFTGIIFGVIRLRTGDALGLAVPRFAGLLLLAALPALRI